MEFLKTNKHKIIFITLLIFTGFLNFWGAWDNGWANTYYSAAVKSMMTSWHNFFYVSFDPAGYVSVDKPALGLWIQCLSAFIFGFKGWALILPQALASVVSVGLLYKMIEKPFGKITGLLAGLFLALTPIFVAVSRINNLDAMLIMFMMLATYFALKSINKGGFRYLLLSVIFVGLGFNVKMVQAFMVLPAIYIAYFIFANIKFKKRIIHLVISTILLLVVSFSWCIAVDLTPKANRPYVGSSSGNSALELAAGYNGVMRAIPGMGEMLSKASSESDTKDSKVQSQVNNSQMQGINSVLYTGDSGFARLLDKELGGQIGWLLPMALIGFVAVCINARKKYIPNNIEKRKAVLFWCAMFAILYLYFSFGGMLHTYYTTSLAPAIAAMAAIGLCEMWNSFKSNFWTKYLLPLSIVFTGIAQFMILSRYLDWNGWIPWVILIISIITSAILVLSKMFYTFNKIHMQKIVLLSIVVLIISPALWSFTPLIYGSGQSVPMAGPELSSDYLKKSGKPPRANLTGTVDLKLENYLLKNSNGEKYILAAPTAITSANIIINTGKAVMSVGGFSGMDHIITVDVLEKMVAKGEIRYFMITDTSAMSGSNNAMMKVDDKIPNWVKEHGEEIPQSDWCSNKDFGPMEHGLKLYDLKVSK